MRSVKIVNPSFTANLVSVIQSPAFATPVQAGEKWAVSAWMATDAPGKELRLLMDFYDAGGAFVHSAHLKFASGVAPALYGGAVTVPPGAGRAVLNIGMHDTGVLWLDGVRFTRLHPSPCTGGNQNLIRSREGLYHVGTTPAITTAAGDDVVVQLANPPGSGRQVHLAVHTLSSEVGGAFLHYFDAVPSVALITSPHVAVANRNYAADRHAALIRFAKAPVITLAGGRLAFAWVVPAGGATIEADQEGKFILRPGSNFTVFGQNLEAGQLYVAFGWWEEEVV